jgi:hypothetical protein
MSRRLRGGAGLALATGVLLVLPVPGVQAATDLGQVGTNHSCGGSGYTEIQTATGAAPRYVVPMDGLINSWSVQMTNDSGVVVRLKMFRPTADPDQFKLIGQSADQAATPNMVNTFPTSIPVQTGDLLGIYVVAGDGYDCLFDTADAGDLAREVNPDNSAVGDTVTITSDFSPTRVNVAATLVPPPVSTPTGPTGQRDAALKKCKKKAKKKHWTKKRLKKCKKKARLLPV